MRIGLIAAQARTATGALRAELPLVGRSVLGWQVALLRDLGAERIICLCDDAAGEVLRLQHEVEASGAAFHALKGFAALPALVRAEDELIILGDGMLPDVAMVRAVAGTNPSSEIQAKVEALHKGVACLPVDHPLTGAFPDDFERIDAARCWAGLLIMRGAPVQQLADFPADADAVSVLLRLALQSGTPCRDLVPGILAPQSLLLADSEQAVSAHQTAMMAAATSPPDWRAPTQALAAVLVRRLAARGYGMGQGPRIAEGAALAVMLAGAAVAGWGAPVTGLVVTALGTFAAQMSAGFAGLAQRLKRDVDSAGRAAAVSVTADALAALTIWFALSPWPEWAPLAICGPLTIGLARLNMRVGGAGLAAASSDLVGLLTLLALSAAAGVLPEACAGIAGLLLAALLLRTGRD